MRLSEIVGRRYKDRPAEATLESHVLLLRGGYARQVANGLFSLLTPGLRVARKIEVILREEMDRLGGQEVRMPLVLPRELWEQSGRYDAVGAELLRFQDRTRHDMVLAMTHEEAVVHLCRGEIDSYQQLPFMAYQIQTKFRDEPRSRGGLIRVREFTMKDAYSFHASQEDLEHFYARCLHAYHRIFTRAGLPEVVAVASDTGMMGGAMADEFMLLTEAGEDTIAVSESGAYRANLDVAAAKAEAFPEAPLPLNKVHTPGCKTIQEVADFLGVPTHKTAKAVFYARDEAGKLVLAVIRGDRDVSETKLAGIIRETPVPAEEETITRAGAVPGYASPMNLDPQQVRVIVDHTICESNNLVTGANEMEYHYENFNFERDSDGAEVADILQADEGDRTLDGSEELRFLRGIEAGNVFQLGTKYSAAMDMAYTDADGATQTPYMGCYGIGVERLISAVIEVRHDKYGPKWPISIAPWQVHIVAIKLTQPGVRDCAEGLHTQLQEAGIEVIYDDRDLRPGAQFAEADLLGVPFRLIVSEKNLKANQVEWKRRDTGESGTIALDEAVDTLTRWVREALQELQGQADGIL